MDSVSWRMARTDSTFEGSTKVGRSSVAISLTNINALDHHEPIPSFSGKVSAKT